MAIWPRYMISSVITFNDIWLSLPIVLTYHLIPIGLYSWYTKSYLSIIRNWFFSITLLKYTSPLLHCWEAY